MPSTPRFPHLERRPSGYFFRRRIPARIGFSNPDQKSFLTLSLRTHFLPDAKFLAARLTALTDRGFAWIMESDMSHLSAEATRILTELARFEIAAHEAVRALAPARSLAEAELAFRREQALQQTLREALACGDREIARAPLRDVAARLGVSLDEGSDDYRALAYEAMRVLLDVSEDRGRREVGQFDGQTAYFRSARAAASEVATSPMAGGQAASAGVASITTPMPASHAATPAQPAAVYAPRHEIARHAPAQVAPADPATNAVPPQRIPVDSSPGPGTDVAVQAAPPTGGHDQAPLAPLRLDHINVGLLSPASVAAINKRDQIELGEAAALYYELKLLGYGEKFDKLQKANAKTGETWKRTSGRNLRTATKIWTDLLCDRAFTSYDKTEIEDVLGTIWRIPTNHGRGESVAATDGYRDLIERTDQAEIKREIRAIEDLKTKGNPTPAEIEAAKEGAKIERLTVATYLRHARFANRVGKMLVGLGIVETNPFAICTWTSAEEADLKKTCPTRRRQVWDDRINALFASPKFQGDFDEVGDPLFWAPLLARFQGLREEECLQLGPDDFGSEDGIAYMTIQDSGMNLVKSEAGNRQLPVHPTLIEIGLLKLVELRRKQGQPRLFPYLERGQTKGNFTELFTKRFGYYRKTNGCYWPGLDFHALRTTFHGDLLNTDCPDAIRRRLMGHEPQDEGEKSYAQGLKMSTLLRNLSKISVDLSMIRSPFAEPTAKNAAKATELGLRVVAGNG